MGINASGALAATAFDDGVEDGSTVSGSGFTDEEPYVAETARVHVFDGEQPFRRPVRQADHDHECNSADAFIRLQTYCKPGIFAQLLAVPSLVRNCLGRTTPNRPL